MQKGLLLLFLDPPHIILTDIVTIAFNNDFYYYLNCCECVLNDLHGLRGPVKLYYYHAVYVFMNILEGHLTPQIKSLRVPFSLECYLSSLPR